MNLLELTYDQLVAQFHQRYARGAFHAAALYRAFYCQTECDPIRLPAFAASPELARRVRADLETTRPAIVDRRSEEGVTKLLFRLADGLAVETVVVPMTRHTTVCISCQVGCRMGCRLCETGRMGLRRSLSAAEIVAQVHAVKVGLALEVRNVVFMGMGEPLDNFDNVVQAIRVLEDQRGLDIAKRRITLSTCGRVDGIQRLAALNWPQLKLAVSLNAADDETRSDLMPINRQYDLAALKQALLGYPLARGNVLLMEYVLIAGVNDSDADAQRLASYLEGLSARLNLIVYNPRRESPYAAPTAEGLQRFHQALVDRNVFVRLRRSKGAGIRAACGQLGAAFNL
ncbi:MAG: 23S rRNA (adenine(2503)-C(2))-methyltransferase RlmN [Desulfatitalea sp.]|nr:23S rRNA (adenine(2503)-C(2))-methyltransferase RlmN [Desulfatitalea sp.]MBI5897134.1 23S rRNA (adenine(2503)-C(2))-methyltransferase RlmN [Desulfobacterales bacterium]